MISIENAEQNSILAVIFVVDNILFSLDASIIQEVVQVKKITPVHHAPTYIIGVMNLRGRVVTVIDLGTRLEMQQVEINDQSRILIVEWKQEYIGVLVSSVSEVVQIEKGDIKPSPGNLNGVQQEFITGVFKRMDQTHASLLDIDKLLDPESVDNEKK
jgi:purine-binding chemotaxis protein CheW